MCKRKTCCRCGKKIWKNHSNTEVLCKGCAKFRLALTKFRNKLSKQQDLPPEYNDMVNEHFWDLI